jgi:xanthine dehydrogenase D subunit
MTATEDRLAGLLGTSVLRPDGVAKVSGQFAFSNDLNVPGMLWGGTLRSAVPYARLRRIDTSAARRMPGVAAVISAADVPGKPLYGLEVPDQPVFARDIVRYVGEPIAAVAAITPDIVRAALERIVVDYSPLEPVVDATLALSAEPIHPDGNLLRRVCVRSGAPEFSYDVMVEGTYSVGMQDQAFMGPECGLAIPAQDGGVELHVATQWLHADQRQIAACLGIELGQVRVVQAGAGGAFGAREDVSLQIHLCLLALRTGCPVKLAYNREESFLGHVHRHPATMQYRHYATAEGAITSIEAEIILDGGAYASTSAAVAGNAAFFACGPYVVPRARIDVHAVRTNNPPCGAMRGFGAVQTCFAHESQMDKLAARCGLDPVEVRMRNLLQAGDRLITGQELDGPAPIARLLRRLGSAPLPPRTSETGPFSLPGGAGRTTDLENVQRGVGYALGMKQLMFAEGRDDYAVARVSLTGNKATITSACAEIGQGFVTVAQQIASDVLGVSQVVLEPATTDVGSAGSSSASRQTWMSGGAIQGACDELIVQIRDLAAKRFNVPVELVSYDGGRAWGPGFDIELGDLLADRELESTFTHRHKPTRQPDENGQGTLHVAFAFAAHRAVVDVDPELGLVRIVDIATTQDVGKILNPVQAVGQIEGGIAQGVGLAVMEELIVREGRIRNPSFTDYLIPTSLDTPPVTVVELVEEPHPDAPFGAKGIGEPPTISSTAAIAAAIRDATGLALPKVPITGEEIARFAYMEG